MSTNPQQPSAPELLAYLQVLARDANPRQFFDVRHITRDGLMRRRFISVLQINQAVRLITHNAPFTDVYVGVVLRDGARSGSNVISGSRLLYIECDHPDARSSLEGFACLPSMIVTSGSPGHLHAYWSLRELASVRQVQSANRRLALALHGDPVSVDIARLLRPPESMNHKHDPPLPVRLIRSDRHVDYELSRLTAELPPDPRPRQQTLDHRGSPHNTGRTSLDRALLAIPAVEYVRVLADREPDRAGKVLCPFHEDTDPSLQLYPDGTFYCFGRCGDRACGKGGTIFDFAAALWGTGTRDHDFLQLRKRLAGIFGRT